ncbi:MAG: class I SAM-dependent DNA methyltransferase [Candidatus Kapaibacterium sp.]|nr:MAG: class I SAM-dependent DNA methyltransferase [Candidatus Kapabacteria bacterium]
MNSLHEFVQWTRTHIKGDEKGEAQIFLDRFFRAFAWEGTKEAGAQYEERIRKKEHGKRTTTSFADLVLRPDAAQKRSGLLVEMKKRGEHLANHYMQAFEYWLHLVPHRPRYVMLCNFDEFWIYDFDRQLDEPMDKLTLDTLPERASALGFMLKEEKTPQFGNNREQVTREAAEAVAAMFRHLLKWKIPRPEAQRFTLQCVFAMFAEDLGLLPNGLFSEIVNESENNPAHSYDAIGGLFRQMNSPEPARGGRFKGVQYFNGGLFAKIEPIELQHPHIFHLQFAAKQDWSKVNPAIFGTLFEQSMDASERHALGAHYTSEADIQKVVLATITRPWRERIDAASTSAALRETARDLAQFRVLDPACGSGNFLYVAYREMKRLERELWAKHAANFSIQHRESIGQTSNVSVRQFFGMDKSAFATELAKVTLLLAKELTIAEAETLSRSGEQAAFAPDDALPLENLDDNIRCVDALFTPWAAADAIIGNPPFQAKNNMAQEFGADYVARLRAAYPDVPGRADYCVFWFRKAHEHLPAGGRAGLVGTNTIRQNFSREGGLDFIVANDGVITNAIGTQVWSGDAAVHVSIVNWIKSPHDKERAAQKILMLQTGDHATSPWKTYQLDRISASLSPETDVTTAKPLAANTNAHACYQGQTHGHEGFLLSVAEAKEMMKRDTKYSDVLFPYLTGDELVGNVHSQPKRFVIDFSPRDVLESHQYKHLFERIKSTVLPAREEAAFKEQERNANVLAENPKARINRHHHNFLQKWWQLSYVRADMLSRIAPLKCYIACARVTKRPIFEFIGTDIRPSDAMSVFAFDDDYSFSVLQSSIHWAWFVAKCSTLEARFRYTSETVFDTFPWAQAPTLKQVQAVAAEAVELRRLRRELCDKHGWSLRELYRSLETPGKHPLRDAQESLDASVRAAYGMKANNDVLEFLLELNRDCVAREARGESITAPGLPPSVKDRSAFVSGDCVRMITG